MAMQYSGRSNHVKSVARAFTLVEAMTKIGREVSITELSRFLGWPKSTVHGILSTLRDYRYVEQSPDSGFYRLGVRFFEVGNMVARSWDIQAVAPPHMHRLNAWLGEMIQLAKEDDGQVLYLYKVDSQRVMRSIAEIGDRLPMYCTGLGKVLLAYKSPAEAKSILKRWGMVQMTGQTITTLPEMEQELYKIRQQGFAMDDREMIEGLRCAAAPVWDREGNVRYAVSVSGMYSNMQETHLKEVLQGVLQCARDISREMGYMEPSVHV